MNLLNPLYLFGLLAIVVPIAIHILQRDRMQRVIFPATRFLLGVSRKLTRTQQWRELLLLILRCLALALLALALCRPFYTSGSQGGTAAAAQGARAVVLAVDVSASMRAGARMDEAKAQARAALAALRPRLDRAALLAFDHEPRAVSAMTDDLDTVAAALAKLEAGFGGTNFPAALQQADRLLQHEEQAGFAREALVFTDLQRTGWSGYSGDWKFSAGTKVSIKPVAVTAAENTGLIQAALPRVTVASPRAETLTLKLAHFGKEGPKPVQVTLTMDGVKTEEKAVTLRPGKPELVRFTCKFERPGDVTGSFTVNARDALAADDTYYFAVRVLPRIQVLLVNGGTGQSRAQDDGYFIRQALSVEGAPFLARESRPEALTAADFDALDAVVLANVRELPAAAAERLARFVEGGGGVLIFAGDRLDPAVFNTALAGIAPCGLGQLIERAEGEEGWTLADVDYRHRIFQPFAAPQSGELGRPRFSKYWLAAGAQSARVLARFLDGRPALLEAAKGKGISLLFTSSAGLAWNDFCLLGGVYVPFLHEAVRYLAVRGEALATAQVGQPLSFEIQSAKAELTPGMGAGKIAFERGAAPFQPTVPGVHELADGARRERFAVNLDPAESDLTPLDPQELLAAVSSDLEGRNAEIGGAHVFVSAPESARERVEQSQRIGWYLLLTVLLVLAAEHILANHTSRN